MIELSCYLLVIGLVVSLYQGGRGFWFQWIRTDPPFKDWSTFKKVFLLAFADGLTYFVTAAAGFVSLMLCWEIIRLLAPAKIEVGTAALLGFLAVFGIFGVTGKMPDLIDRGELRKKLSPLSFGDG